MEFFLLGVKDVLDKCLLLFAMGHIWRYEFQRIVFFVCSVNEVWKRNRKQIPVIVPQGCVVYGNPFQRMSFNNILLILYFAQTLIHFSQMFLLA